MEGEDTEGRDDGGGVMDREGGWARAADLPSLAPCQAQGRP